ncbi:MAG: hypothetical protein WED05_10060 [Candidatus Atabeyarchaeum deiterrae]
MTNESKYIYIKDEKDPRLKDLPQACKECIKAHGYPPSPATRRTAYTRTVTYEYPEKSRIFRNKQKATWNNVGIFCACRDHTMILPNLDVTKKPRTT